MIQAFRKTEDKILVSLLAHYKHQYVVDKLTGINEEKIDFYVALIKNMEAELLLRGLQCPST